MKKGIIGIIICMLLIASPVLTGAGILGTAKIPNNKNGILLEKEPLF